jgi:DNA-binding cell septation regulator SpoVG
LILSFSQKRLEPKLAEVALDEAIIVLDLRRSQGQRNGFDTAHPKRKTPPRWDGVS